MSFFNKDFLDFFNELSKNNNRDWFTKNKERYESSVRKPFENFVQDMIYRIHEDDESLMVTPKECIFRIYRDIRFSKNKTPYKTFTSAVIGNGGRKNYTDPGIYIELSREHLRFYSGIYQLEKEQLQNVRTYISSNLGEFEKLLKDRAFKRYFGTIRGEQNKRIPKEFNEVLERQPLISNKQFYFFTELASERILSKNLSNDLMKYYFAAKPTNNFLKRALKNR